MKRLHYILFTILVLASSCVREEMPVDETPDYSDGQKVRIAFDLGIPTKVSDSWSEADVETKSFGDLTDERRLSLKLRLYVFDESGFLVEARDADSYANDNTFEDAHRNETKFSVDLTRSKNKRTIHFVAVDAGSDEFDDVVHEAYHYGSETTFMSGLSVGNDVDAYWGRIEMPGGIDGPTAEDPDVTPTTFTRVPMIRNYAKITVVEPTLSNFTLTGFALVNVPAHGSVAPYNSTTGSFVKYYYDEDTTDDYNLEESVRSYKEISSTGYRGYLPLGISESNMWKGAISTLTDASFTKAAKYMYESPNSTEETKGKSFIIIKGNYVDTANNRTYNNRYYKVDIVYKDTAIYEETGVFTYYNILRNFNYIIRVLGVSFEGYASATEAAEKPASNNISASVLAEGVNNVSDGNGSRRLFVNKIYSLYTSGGNKDGDLSARGIMSDDTAATPGTDMYITVLEDEDGIIQGTPTFGAVVNGYYSINLTLAPVSSVPRTATLRVYVKEGTYETLYRDITIVLREPYDLKVDCTDIVRGNSGEEMNAKLLVPDGINKALFPLVFLMEPAKKSLSPYASKNQLAVHVGNSIVPGSETETSFQFEREISYEQYMASEIKTIGTTKYRIINCFFKTTTADNATTVYAKNEYFDLTNAHDSFKNGTPVFVDGDGAYAEIFPSDYYGAGNSKHYVEFKTVRNTGTVSVILEEEDQTTTVSYNLSGGTNNGDGTYSHKLEILSKTFKGSDYHVSVVYNNEFEQTITGSATQMRRYLYLPLGSFETNVNTANGYLNEEYFRASINVASTQWAVSGAQPEYMGKVFITQSGINYSYGRDADSDATYKGWKFATADGYHFGIEVFHPGMVLTEDMVIHFYDPQSAKNATWVANARIGDVTSRHAVDFQAGATEATGTAAGLYKMPLTFAPPTP